MMQRPNPLRLLLVLLVLLSPAISSAAGTAAVETVTVETAAVETAEALAERMLKRLGGREHWASLRNTINGSSQYRSAAPTEVYSVITMDFETPRIRFDTTATDINLIRVINGNKSWRISWSGQIEDLPESSFVADTRWYQAHIYRTIHRIAKADPDLHLQLAGENQLEVLEDGERLIWFRLTEDAEPFAFGFRDDDLGSLSGPWTVEQQGIRHPAWVSSHDGTWRAAVKSLEVNVPLLDAMFSRPVAETAEAR